MDQDSFPSTRAEALRRLAAFAPSMGEAYAAGRNTDRGPGRAGAVSALSPAVRHRLVTEEELVGTALARHGMADADKFIQEVFWRTYWKGWLELRPGVWDAYRAQLARDRQALAANAGLRRAYEQALAGTTGIACFDAWMTELRERGWLHNHVRMWTASIWIFTLRLPWTLGADLFLHHLLDGDPASNTLSWRWVGGIQTPGKHYVARAENIRRHTEGRFDPQGELDENPQPLLPETLPPAQPVRPADALPKGPVALLLHEEDCHPEGLLPVGTPVQVIAGAAAPQARGPTGCSGRVEAHVRACVTDAVARAAAFYGAEGVVLRPTEVPGWAAAHGLAVVTPDIPVGWTAEALAGLPLLRLRRAWDAACWPLAARGFFQFRAHIPGLLRQLRPAAPA
jgi:deoxyribodipyrimidine photo-lyase